MQLTRRKLPHLLVIREVNGVRGRAMEKEPDATRLATEGHPLNLVLHPWLEDDALPLVRGHRRLPAVEPAVVVRHQHPRGTDPCGRGWEEERAG